MYTPAHFAETRPEILHDLIVAHPLGTLVTLTSRGLDANHVPFELERAPGEAAPFGVLRAHVARANPVWQDFSAVHDALVIFQGPQTYITPTWYQETKPATGKVVPTWNYCVVHAHGPLRIIDDREWLRGMVTRLTERFETARAAAGGTAWKVSDAPADFIDKQLGAIVGIEIPLARLAGKWKVSQNRPEADRAGIVSGLRADDTAGARAMADAVEARTQPR